MAAPQTSVDDGKVLAQMMGVPDNHLVSWGMLKKIVAVIRRNLPVQGEGMELDWAANGGCVFSVQDLNGDEPYQFQILPGEDGTVTLSPGTVNGIVPTIGGDVMTDYPSLSVSAGDNIWVKCDVTPDLNDGFVQNVTLNSVEIEAGESVPEDTLTGDVYTIYRVLAYIDEEGNGYNYVRYSLELSVCDDNTGTGSGVAQFGVSG